MAPHLEQFSSMSFENFPARFPVGKAFLRSLHAKVCTLGAITLSCQTWFRSRIICWGTLFGRCLSGSSRLLKQCLYALFGECLPAGVSFHTRVSCPAVLL